ncbi:DUF3253 domain-containing protein [Ancylobacter sp. VNQ12]|uniref:DUF3253 domain-containing protein n=1 Tax=Ancylobacter sp. VNQ12 TaxID=3400920 RepID=UPI003C03EA10
MTEPSSRPPRPSEEAVEAAVLEVAAAAEKGRSITPEDVARAVSPGPQWHGTLPAVRRAAIRLAKAGKIVIYRKGKPVDPDELRGVFRLGLPPSDG